jgi:hypothetical protein
MGLFLFSPAVFVFHRRLCQPRWHVVLALALLFIPWQAICAQDDMFQGPAEPWLEPFLASEIRLEGASHAETSPVERPARFQLFGMPPGFLCEPVGLDSGDDTTPPLEAASPFRQSPPDRLQVVLGTDNPFFDVRSRGDPGGPGYYRVHYQYQLVDGQRAGLCLNCRAVTPAGLEADGLAHGPTFLSPALAWFQELGDDTTMHAFVGKHIRASSQWADHLEQRFQYGVALQRPLPGLAQSSGGNFHMFVEALGRQRNYGALSERPPAAWEVLPGLHWGRENWWLTGGLIFPVGGPRPENGLWQITCSWRF